MISLRNLWMVVLLSVGLVATGCDALQEDGTPEAPLDDASLADQVDASLVDDDVQNMLLSDEGVDEAALSKHGFSLYGAVFTMSNAADGNEILAYRRAPDGTLTPAGTYPTYGLGSGDGLGGTSNPMAFVGGNKILLAVNGGSDEISAFRVEGATLHFLGKVYSGGPFPNSITVHRNLIYVLNAGRDGQPGNIHGFIIRADGHMLSVDETSAPLSDGAAGPPQIDFNPRGNLLVVTDRPTNTIITYHVRNDGTVGSPNAQPSVGETPFGFDFDRHGRLFVSEAFGGAPDASTLSSYSIRNGTLNTISASVPTTETAACWVEIFGRYAYATNTGSGSISGYRIAGDGSVSLLDADGVTATTGGGPLDMDIALRYLYVHSNGNNRLGIYKIGHDGSLSSVPGAITGLPATAVGVAAY